MKGWLDKYVPKAQNGIEGTMGGLTDKGFNYSPAWGGQFAMGGSLPGAVGFTYARTAGAAPANGPYAKKTKASAQNGAKIPVIEDAGSFNKEGVWIPDWEKMTAQAKKLGAKKVRTKHGSVIYFNDKWEVSSVDDNPDAKAQNGQEMKYYQEGLDFQPRTISQDGTRVAAKPRPLTKAEYEENQRISQAQKKGTEKKKQEVLAERKQARETKGTFQEKNFNIGEKLRLFPGNVGGMGEIFDDYINPFKIVGDLASNLGNSRTPEEAALNVAMTAGLGAIGFDPLGSTLKSPATKATIKQLSNAAKTAVDLPRAKTIKEAIGRIGGIPLSADIPRMTIEDVKALRQVQEIGRLRATNTPHSGQMKYALENNLPEDHFQKVFGMSKNDAQQLLNTGLAEQEAARSAGTRSRINLRRPERRAENAREVLIRYLEQQPSLHYGEERVVNIVGEGADDLGGAINFRALSNEQLARLRDFSEEQNALLRQMDPSLSESLDWDMTDISSAINNIERSSSNIDRSTQARNILESFRREMDNQLASPPEYFNLDLSDSEIAEISSAIGNIERSSPSSRNLAKPTLPSPLSSFTPIEDVASIVRELPGDLRYISSSLNNKINDFFIKNSQNYPYYSGEVLEKVPHLTLSSSGSLKNVSKKVNFAPEGINSGDVFTGSMNTSHSSYLPQLKQVFKYDKGAPQFLGYKPMNELGFLSQYEYEARDIAKYLNSEIDEQIKRGIVPKDIQRPFLKNDRVILPHYGIKQYKKGGVIKDDRGQWAHPGEITQIDSNDITMQGVPYPVLGIGADGQRIMMEPGEDYRFNKGPVTEFPMAQKGINIPAPTAADSLRVHNAAIKLLDYYKNDKRHFAPKIENYTGKIERSSVDRVGQENLNMYREMVNDLTSPAFDYENSMYKLDYGLPRLELLKKVAKAIGESKSASPGTAYYKDAFPSKIDINAPSAYVDYRISPQGFVYFDSNTGYPSPAPAGAVTGAWYYDPLAVKPYAMRTPQEKLEWEKKYGKKEQSQPQPKKEPKKEAVKKPEPVVKKPVEKPTQKVVEKPVPPKPTNKYEGRPFYAPGAGVGGSSPLVGFIDDRKGDTTYIQPEDYERFAVDPRGRKYIESKKKLKSGGSVNNADAQPLKKLDQLTNFTNYNKPTKGGWLDKYE